MISTRDFLLQHEYIGHGLGVALILSGSIGLGISHGEILTYIFQQSFPYIFLFVILLGSTVIAATKIVSTLEQQRRAAANELEQSEREKNRTQEAAFAHLEIDPINIVLGADLAAELLASDNAENTLDRVQFLREEIARETGIVIPRVRVGCDATLSSYEYTIFIRQRRVAVGEVREGCMLAIGLDSSLRHVGEATLEPVYHSNAQWIPEADGEMARKAGALIFDRLAVILSHVGQAARDHLEALFTRQEFAKLVEHVRGKAPALVAAIEACGDLSVVYKTYLCLLHESVWPNDVIVVFEAILNELELHKPQREWMNRSYRAEQTPQDFAKLLEVVENPQNIAEAVRKKIIPIQLLQRTKPLGYLGLSESLKKRIHMAWSSPLLSFGDIHLAPEIRSELEQSTCYIVTAPDERRVVSEFFSFHDIRVHVYAMDELPKQLIASRYGVISECNVTTGEIPGLPAFPL